MFVRVLLVDDEPAFREMVESQLSKEGFPVSCAGSGMEALDQLKRNPFDVMLLDYHLPDISGPEVLRRMKELNIRTQVIMLTGEQGLDRAAETINLGVDDYLLKPHFARHLVACIRRVMEKGVRQPHRG